METALVTGMLENEFLPVKQAKMDVKESNTESFGEVFEASLKKNDVVEGKDVSQAEESQKENVVDEKNKDVEENTNESEIDETKGKEKKEDKSKKHNLIFQNQIVEIVNKDVEIKENIKLQDVEKKDVIALVGSIKNGEIAPEEKLDNLLSKLDVKFNQNVQNKDDGEKVIKVGPQNVETEKIELNIKDVESKLKENSLEEKVFVSKKENFNNPEIQNPFKIKKSTDEIETNKVENSEIILNDIDVELPKDVSNKNLINNEINIKDVNDEEIVENISDNFDVQNEFVYEDTGSDLNKDLESKNSNRKEDKVKIRDFRNRKDVEFSDKLNIKEEVKFDNKIEIKEISNIRKFENINFEQDVLEQVTEKLEVSLFDNKSEMVIKLKPNDLGKVTVKISIENGVMNAKFLADSIKVKETLESNLNNLKESLKEQGLNVQDLNVSVDSGRAQSQMFEQNNLRNFNARKNYQVDNEVSYEDTYYEFSNVNTEKIRNYWMDSTVSFLA